MIGKLRRRWQLSRVAPGDGSALRTYRSWQLLSRSLFYLQTSDPAGRTHLYAVDVRHLADAKTGRQRREARGTSPVALYDNGVQVLRANLPASFPVEGGVIEAASSVVGLKRMRFVAADGRPHPLTPHPRSREGLRATLTNRFPRVSAAIGGVSLAVLLTLLVVALLKAAEALTAAPAIGQEVGTFSSPVDLPAWATGVLAFAGVLAATERASRLQHHWLIDSAAS